MSDVTTPLLHSGHVNPTRSLSYVILLTIIVGGLQLSYSAEFANGTPYLLSLGMSKTLMSLVWVAGPISGAIGQPLVGILSDESRLKYGRRRPFIIGGAVATIVSLLVLSWSKDIVGLFASGSEEHIKHTTIPFAVFCIYVLDFSIQVIQAATRAFIVDNVPTHQQQSANAWAARMIGIGNIIAYALGSSNLPNKFPWLGNSQFKVLSAFACIALVLTVTPACLAVRERDPNDDAVDSPIVDSSRGKLRQVWDDTVKAIKNLSPQTRLVCNIQFFAWIGYFPMLYYTTTYVGEMYVRQVLDERAAADPSLPPLTKYERELLEEDGTRRGTQALVVYSVSSLIFNFLLPYITQESYHQDRQDRLDNKLLVVNRILGALAIPGLTVGKVWFWSHLMFAFLAMSTFWIRTSTGATVFVGFLGLSWAVCQWAPFTVLSQEISRIKDKKVNCIGNTSANRPHLKYEHQAGIVLGVMNVFVCLPQVVASLASSIIFRLTDSPENGGQSIGWVFRFGGLAALVAAYLTFFIKHPKQLDREEDNQH